MPRREQPLESGNELLVEFARDLRGLREKAGGPTYRVLSARAHYSAAALSEAASGRKLPSLAVTLAYVAACDGDTAAWKERWHQTAAETSVARAVEPNETDHDDGPYAGLAAFQIGDADRFFGRERLVADLVTRVRERRFLGVFGASGSGKSSILRAGLMAHLACHDRPAVVFTPGPHPIEECAVRLAAVLNVSSTMLLAEFAADPKNLHLRVRQAMADRPDDTDLVLVVDQFEELFTLCRDPDERAWLITALTTAASAPTSRTRVVLGVRADFYGHCGQHPQLVDALGDAQVLVGPMTSAELRRAIIEPAALSGRRVETALVTELVAAAAYQPGVLPLVSHVLLETWRRRRGTTLTLAGYEAAGGLRAALSRTAEAIYTSLTSERQAIAKQILLRLCSLGDMTEDTKRRVSRHELDTSPDTGAVLDQLAQSRLITLERDSVEITHEALIGAWPRLRKWLVDDRDALRVHRQLTEATATWKQHHHDPGTLLRGARLAVIKDWAHNHHGANRDEREFLDASVAADEHERRAGRRRARLLRAFAAVLVVLLVIVTAVAVYATNAQQTATRQRNVAVALNAIRDAEALVNTNPALAAHISLAAYRLHPSPPTRDSLIANSAAANPTPLALIGPKALAPNGRLIATATGFDEDIEDITVLSTISGQDVTEAATLKGGQYPAGFSPDSRILPTVDQDAVLRLWDVSDPTRPHILATLPRKSMVSVFSPNGSMLVTMDAEARPIEIVEGSVIDGSKWTIGNVSRLWDITDISRPRELGILADSNPPIAFSNSGRIIATVDSGLDPTSTHEIIRLWDITAPETPRPAGQIDLPSNVVGINVAFGEKDQVLLVGDDRGFITVWDVSAPDAPRKLSTINERRDSIHIMMLSPDKHSLAATDRDGGITLWDISKPRTPEKIFDSPQGGLNPGDVVFSPDGSTLQAVDASSHSGKSELYRWHLDADQSAAIVCDQVTRRMTEADWNNHFIGVPYQPPCE